jgi:hypothetical protein
MEDLSALPSICPSWDEGGLSGRNTASGRDSGRRPTTPWGQSKSAVGNQVIRYSERPGLWDAISALSEEVWPEYNLHGDVLGGYWDRLYYEFAEFQFVLYDDEAHEVIAEGHTIPCDWDDTPDGLGDRIDAAIAGAFDARERHRMPTALCALAAEISR